jgi:hypothetical protein
MSTKFIENRNLFHTFSRIAIQEGQGVAAAVNKTGHTVTSKDVWADIAKLPQNTKYEGSASKAFTDLKAVYDSNAAEYSKYVKLYEKAVLSPVAESDAEANKNQTWELLIDGKRVKNFVAPTDVFDADGKPCNGYTLTLFDQKNGEISPKDGNWAFDYVAGLVIFEQGQTPEDMGWATTTKGTTTGPIKITAWAYVGDYLSDTLSGYDSALSGYTTPLAISSEFKNVRELITNVQSEALGIEAGSGIVFGSNISGDTIINVDIADNDKVLSFGETGLSTTISLVKLESAVSGYAASYQLQGLSGEVLGDTINIAKDQFLKGAEITEGAMISGKFTSKAEIEELIEELPEDEQVEIKKFIHFTFEINKKDANGKVTSDENNVYLNIHELIDVYTGGNAIEVTSNNVINLVKSNKSENFFFVDSTGGGVSGVQNAIDLAASGLISGVAKIPSTTSGFEYNTLVFTADGETAIIDVVNNKVVDISEENVEAITTTTLSSSLPTVNALTGYVEKATSGILPDAKNYADNNFLKEVEVSGAQALSVTQKADNEQTISLAISTQPGNAIVDAASGLFVQKYVAGKNITLSANVSGEMTINGSNDYVLPVATSGALGGILASGDISVDTSGKVTVLAASQVKQSLSFGD